MVVAAKKAVGAEYGYQMPNYTAKKEKAVRVRVSRRTSPMAIMACGALMIAMLFCVGLSYTFIKASKAKLHFEISQLQQNNQNIAMENEKLKLEIAQLKSLDRIEEIASAQMGMIRNPEIEYLALQYDNSEAVSASKDITQITQSEEDMNKELSVGQRLIQGIAAVVKEKNTVEKS